MFVIVSQQTGLKAVTFFKEHLSGMSSDSAFQYHSPPARPGQKLDRSVCMSTSCFCTADFVYECSKTALLLLFPQTAHGDSGLLSSLEAFPQWVSLYRFPAGRGVTQSPSRCCTPMAPACPSLASLNSLSSSKMVFSTHR